MAFADSPKISQDLAGRNGSNPVTVIVQFNHAPTTLYHQKVLSLGGTLLRELGLVNAGVYSIPASALPALAADPDVVYITPDRPVRSAGNASPTAVLDYHNETINAPTAWSWGLNGAGIGVAVIDSGITDPLDLDNNVASLIAFSQDFTGSVAPLISTATALMSPASSPETAPGPPDGMTLTLSSALPTT